MEQVRPDTRLLPTAQADDTDRRSEARDAAVERMLQRPEFDRVPAPQNAHPDAYGLMVGENGLGLRAAPGASVIVEPIAPTGAGLAVFYLRDRSQPTIFDLTHDFDPRYARGFASGSEVQPLIDIVEPQTGRSGRMSAGKVEKIHRVAGVYTPHEIMVAHRSAPKPLPVMRACPENMGEHYVGDTSAYPLVRQGETVIVDPAKRELVDGALCLIEWSGGRRSVLQTNLCGPESVLPGSWFVDPVNRPSNSEMMHRQLKSGVIGLLHASDGPYDADHLQPKIVGRVVAILVPDRQGDESGADRPATVAQTVIAAARAAAADAGLTSEVSEAVLAAIENHRDTLTACLAEVAEDDETFTRLARQEQAADEALRQAPCRSLADLRAKLTYLLPIISPDMLDDTHVRQLEAIRADMGRLCRERSRPADNHEDADLLRLGEQLDRAHAHWRRMEWQAREPHRRVDEGLKRLKEQGSRTEEDYRAIWAPPEISGPLDAESAAYNAAVTVSEAIWKLPHRTPAGLAVKARAAIVDYFGGGNFEDDASLGDDEDMDPKAVRRLVEACCTLAGVDWRGDPIAPPLPDPIFPAIKRHLAARAACLGLDDGRDKEGYEAAHDRRQEALEAVESTQPTTVAGLFALARHIDATLNEDLPGQPVEPTIHGHAFVALINACIGLYEARYPGMDRDWAAAAAYHPGFLPVPQHQPAALMALEYAIPQEAARLLALAEAEFERRREAYVGFHDPTVWPRVAADLRRDMRMDALAIAARPGTRRSPSTATGVDPILAAIERHATARAALEASCNAQDEAWVAEHGGDTSADAMAPAIATYEANTAVETAAWIALFEERPTTVPGVLMLLWHAAKWASSNDGLIGAPALDEIFEHIGDGLAGILGFEAEVDRQADGDAQRRAFAVAAADMLDHDLVTEIWARAREIRPEAFAGGAA